MTEHGFIRNMTYLVSRYVTHGKGGYVVVGGHGDRRWGSGARFAPPAGRSGGTGVAGAVAGAGAVGPGRAGAPLARSDARLGANLLERGGDLRAHRPDGPLSPQPAPLASDRRLRLAVRRPRL